jgi:hypothetical protein
MPPPAGLTAHAVWEVETARCLLLLLLLLLLPLLPGLGRLAAVHQAVRRPRHWRRPPPAGPRTAVRLARRCGQAPGVAPALLLPGRRAPAPVVRPGPGPICRLPAVGSCCPLAAQPARVALRPAAVPQVAVAGGMAAVTVGPLVPAVSWASSRALLLPPVPTAGRRLLMLMLWAVVGRLLSPGAAAGVAPAGPVPLIPAEGWWLVGLVGLLQMLWAVVGRLLGPGPAAGVAPAGPVPLIPAEGWWLVGLVGLLLVMQAVVRRLLRPGVAAGVAPAGPVRWAVVPPARRVAVAVAWALELLRRGLPWPAPVPLPVRVPAAAVVMRGRGPGGLDGAAPGLVVVRGAGGRGLAAGKGPPLLLRALVVVPVVACGSARGNQLLSPCALQPDEAAA